MTGVAHPVRRRMVPLLLAGFLAGTAMDGGPRAAIAAGPSGGPAPAPAAAPTSPLPVAAVRQEVVRQVPPMWRVEDVAVEGGPVTGAEVAAVARLAVRVRLAAPTFAIEQRHGPVTFIRPVAQAGMEKTLTGTAVGVKGDGGWSVTVELQNADVLDSVGRPAAELPGRTVVAGSEEARTLRAELAAQAGQRLAEEEERRKAEEERLARQAAADRAVAERAEAERRAVEARARQIADLRAKLLGSDRPQKIAAYEAALGGNDTALRLLAVEAALQSRDPVLANMALKDWFARRRSVPVQLYATREDANSETVLHNMGPLTLEVETFNPVSGALNGRLGAPGYSIARPSSAVGGLAQSELTVNTFGCGLTLRLTEHRTLDGLYRCQTLPALIARITLD